MIGADSSLRLYNKLLGNLEVYTVPELIFWNVYTFYVDSQGWQWSFSYVLYV